MKKEIPKIVQDLINKHRDLIREQQKIRSLVYEIEKRLMKHGIFYNGEGYE